MVLKDDAFSQNAKDEKIHVPGKHGLLVMEVIDVMAKDIPKKGQEHAPQIAWIGQVVLAINAKVFFLLASKSMACKEQGLGLQAHGLEA